MGIIQIIILILSNLGTIYKLVKLIFDLINREKDPELKRADLADLKLGIKEFNASGDKGPLKRLLERLEARRQA